MSVVHQRVHIYILTRCCHVAAMRAHLLSFAALLLSAPFLATALRIEVSESVKKVLRSPLGCVVALESTVISHGLPFPQNIELAALLERRVSEGGCTPATVYIEAGVTHVGLPADPAERQRVLHLLGDGNASIVKVSRRDFSYVAAMKLHGEHFSFPLLPLALLPFRFPLTSLFGFLLSRFLCAGATTVAATMMVAHAAGIDVFATGGIGGVHRHGELTMDVSADLR
jgi:pseudouridine-5'-phosphate glycosidase